MYLTAEPEISTSSSSFDRSLSPSPSPSTPSEHNYTPSRRGYEDVPDDRDYYGSFGYRRTRTRKSDAVQRHFAQLYEPSQLQEVNDLLEMGWSCAICLDTADDPCVTRCGHMYCREHISECLAKSLTCPVCNKPCTPSLDILPVFSRDDDPNEGDFVLSSSTDALASLNLGVESSTPDSALLSAEFLHVSGGGSGDYRNASPTASSRGRTSARKRTRANSFTGSTNQPPSEKILASPFSPAGRILRTRQMGVVAVPPPQQQPLPPPPVSSPLPPSRDTIMPVIPKRPKSFTIPMPSLSLSRLVPFVAARSSLSSSSVFSPSESSSSSQSSNSSSEQPLSALSSSPSTIRRGTRRGRKLSRSRSRSRSRTFPTFPQEASSSSSSFSTTSLATARPERFAVAGGHGRHSYYVHARSASAESDSSSGALSWNEQGFLSYLLVHYLGITLRVVALAMFLAYLLPRGLWRRNSSIGGVGDVGEF